MITTPRTDEKSIDDTITCLLPIREPVRITQGFFGKYSHKKIRAMTDYSYSLDFAVPIGTVVYAARDGIIRSFNHESEEFYEGLDLKEGSWTSANYIEIRNDDGTCTSYQHLMKDFSECFNLYKGKEIHAGEPIAITGLSGWIGNNPHLHISIIRRQPGIIEGKYVNMTTTVPFRFKDYTGPLYDKDL